MAAPDAPEPLPADRIAALLDAAGRALRAELEALGDDEAAWHPAPGEWCVKEVLGHIIEAERRGFAGRIERTLAAERPVEPGWDQEAVAAERADCGRPVGELIAEFTALRDESVRLVRGLRPHELERACLHARVGELRVGDLLHEWVHHDRNHIRQALANVQARAWPHMGNAQRFSEVD